MKNFIVERRVNPFDKFVKYKQFKTLEKAQQSCEMLKKHVSNIIKDSEYYKYRIFDKINQVYYE